MAKKTSARSGEFVMARELRNILSESRDLSGKQALSVLKERFPKEKINENSFGVAFSGARRALGISKGRKKVRIRKPGAGPARSTAVVTVDIETLQAARRYLTQVGDAERAISAIKQLQTLQIG
ncbi:MAG: hypothetical protein KF861_05985 [Planctomycetaceae bacterium]|nr:hypothetical protein [Planctomycetaceae bacterium]